MKKIILLLSLILAACAPVASATAIDPYVMAEQAQRTAEAAKDKADFYGSQLTATAQAPIVAMTQTSSAFSMVLTQAAATTTAGIVTQSAAGTQTAQSWTPIPTFTPTPNATTTAIFNQSQIESSEAQSQMELNNLRIERVRRSNNFWAVILPIFLILLIVAIIYAGITLSRIMRKQIVQRDANGDAPLLYDVVDAKYVDMDANPNHTTSRKSLGVQVIEHFLETKYGFIPDMPHITAARQDAVKERDQSMDHEVRISALIKRLPQSSTSSAPRLSAPASSMVIPDPVQGGAFDLPTWDIIKNWDGKGGIPYYTAHGLKFIDPDSHAHIAVLGATGSGKSRAYIRPFIACALALGDRVVIIGKQADYVPFQAHPNCRLFPVSKFTQDGEALRYVSILKAIVEEMNRRDDVLASSGRSTWSSTGAPRTWIVLDEFTNALSMMGENAAHAKTWAQGLLNEGRKNGFNIVLAGQRATGIASLLSQTGKAVFRVEHDEEKAHRSLAGASMLSTGFFWARFGSSDLAGGFYPSDKELLEFFQSRPAKQLAAENWIDGKLIEPARIVSAEAPMIVPTDLLTVDRAREMADEQIKIEDRDADIIRRYIQKQSLAQIQREVFEDVTTGGANFNKIKAIIKDYENTTTTHPFDPLSPNLSGSNA